MNNLKITIVKLETSLFSANTRTSFDRLNKLIADDFIEVGASGIRFDKQHVLERLPTETPPEIEAGDFELRVLAENCVQLLYRSVMKKSDGLFPIYSHRCSIWQCNKGQWQMTFHQGTKCDAFELTKKVKNKSH